MGIDRLTKAANAAGYAMANSEELLEPAPRKGAAHGWRAADPAQQGQERPKIKSAKPAGGFRDWWFALSSRATA